MSYLDFINATAALFKDDTARNIVEKRQNLSNLDEGYQKEQRQPCPAISSMPI